MPAASKLFTDRAFGATPQTCTAKSQRPAGITHRVPPSSTRAQSKMPSGAWAFYTLIEPLKFEFLKRTTRKAVTTAGRRLAKSKPYLTSLLPTLKLSLTTFTIASRKLQAADGEETTLFPALKKIYHAPVAFATP